MPKVYRSSPVDGSMPTMLRRTPTAPAVIPFMGSPPPMLPMSRIPITASRKKSLGENLREKLAITGAATERTIIPTKLANTETVVQSPMALPASPLWARGYPSIPVAIAAGAPGMFSRMAVMEPP